MEDYMKKDVEEIIRERIEENKNLFTEDEIKKINKEIKLIKKMYVLGFINARQIYINDRN